MTTPDFPTREGTGNYGVHTRSTRFLNHQLKGWGLGCDLNPGYGYPRDNGSGLGMIAGYDGGGGTGANSGFEYIRGGGDMK